MRTCYKLYGEMLQILWRHIINSMETLWGHVTNFMVHITNFMATLRGHVTHFMAFLRGRDASGGGGGALDLSLGRGVPPGP